MFEEQFLLSNSQRQNTVIKRCSYKYNTNNFILAISITGGGFSNKGVLLIFQFSQKVDRYFVDLSVKLVDSHG